MNKSQMSQLRGKFYANEMNQKLRFSLVKFHIIILICLKKKKKSEMLTAPSLPLHRLFFFCFCKIKLKFEKSRYFYAYFKIFL